MVLQMAKHGQEDSQKTINTMKTKAELEAEKRPSRLQLGEAYMMCQDCGCRLYSFDGNEDVQLRKNVKMSKKEPDHALNVVLHVQCHGIIGLAYNTLKKID